MSIKKTKEQLIKLLKNPDNKVIALSGNWGTGKTHLWNEVREESSDDKVKASFYVSLFGLSGIDQIKRKLCESAIPGAEAHGGIFDGLKKVLGSSMKTLAQHYKALAVINDLNIVLMAPILLKGTVIVIDDIERKHDKLGIDEVLGFIDEYSNRYACRFVLVLNDDQLSNNVGQEKLWATFREKVIDQEIRLTTSPDEAFAIALSATPTEHALALKKAIATCGLSNIRIIKKVIRVANELLSEHNLDEAIQARVVPSIVLFSAIHYRGLRDGPDFKFALNIGPLESYKLDRNSDNKPSTQEKREVGWRLLMNELGILACDEFEKCLVKFLESGLYDSVAIKDIIDRYIQEKDAMVALGAAKQFLDRVIWDHPATDAELISDAEKFLVSAGLLDEYIVTQIQEELARLANGAQLGEDIIDCWIATNQRIKHIQDEDDNVYGKPLHPKILQKLAEVRTQMHSNTTVIDACMHIVNNQGWGTIQEAALQRATTADFDAAIRYTKDLIVFRRFMRQMIQMSLKNDRYTEHFGSACDRFLEACRSIANDDTSPRLRNLMHILFEKTAIASEVLPPAAPTEASTINK